jgi:putative aldouronate transport system permease protein
MKSQAIVGQSAGWLSAIRKLGLDLRKDWDLYAMLIPGIIFVAIFRYTPMYGVLIAFKDFNIFSGMKDSPWVGMANFNRLFQSEEFANVFTNTIVISLMKIVFLFPLPIIMALLMNEIGSVVFKRSIQTVAYLPHFLSWVIVSGLFLQLLSVNDGVLNQLLTGLGLHAVPFFMDNGIFRWVLLISAGWKETGWSTIVYLAAITTIDPSLYEAARMDGAGRFRQMWNVTLPGMAPVILLMLILRLGSILDAGTEQILVMYNPTVYPVSDVIGTFVYRIGLGQQDYSFSTAVGLFESAVAFVMVLGGNFLSRKYLERGIW